MEDRERWLEEGVREGVIRDESLDVAGFHLRRIDGMHGVV
jgi:hypothetical protein